MLDQALALDDLWRVAHAGARVELAPDTLDAVARNRAVYERVLAEGGPVYGVTTGLGALVSQPLPPAPATDVAASLLRSHAAGVGRELPRELVRGALTARLRVLARARSGVRPRLLHAIAACSTTTLCRACQPASSAPPASSPLRPTRSLC